MNFVLRVINKIGSPVEELGDLFGLLEGPCEEQQFETFSSFTFPTEGLAFSFDQSSELVSVHLYSAGLDGKAQYRRGLPFNIAFGDRRIHVAGKFGSPPEASGGGHQWNGKEVPNWDRYCFNEVLIHFQYSRVDQGVELVTIMAKNQVASKAPAI